ncbi:MAG TPA: hypothetical protein VM008_12635 [Phycisphaerae bacterium]|nr:hypothetical protein [Phycisphaerae bacterium]
MGLLNVRLDKDLQRKANALRREGVVLSDLVREAVTAAYEKHRPRGSRVETLRNVLDRYPEGAGHETLNIDATDRRAVQAHIRRRAAGKKK